MGVPLKIRGFESNSLTLCWFEFLNIVVSNNTCQQYPTILADIVDAPRFLDVAEHLNFYYSVLLVQSSWQRLMKKDIGHNFTLTPFLAS